jgi:hypothetical protein
MKIRFDFYWIKPPIILIIHAFLRLASKDIRKLMFFRHWRTLVVLFCFLMGGYLLFPATRLFPVIIDLATVNHNLNHNLGYQSTPIIPTPFQPSSINRIYLPSINHNIHSLEQLISENFATPLFEKIDFSSAGEPITIMILPDSDYSRHSQPIEITFLPDEQCIYGDGKACVYSFFSNHGKQVLFASVHSGVGGEGEIFRSVIEGTGINQGLHTAHQVSDNINSLTGSQVTILQAGVEFNGLELMAIIRVPPEQMQAYLALPVEKTLDFIVELKVLYPEVLNQDLLVIETCGWRLPGEPRYSGLSDTSGSIYLGIMRIAN